MSEEREVITENRPIHYLFEETAQQNPDKVALVCNGKEMSYKELSEKADLVKNYLLDINIKSGESVAIMVPLSIDMIVAIIGVMKAGAAFVPIKPDFPENRIKYMLSSSSCSYIIHNGNLEKSFDQVTNIDICKDIPLDIETSFSPNVVASDLAYILYTSGSTGNPKGVMIEHKSISNYIGWATNTYINDQKLNFALFTPLHFDLTLTSIFTPLVSGNTIFIFEESVNKINLHRILENEKVDIVKLTPSHLKIISRLNIPRSSIKKFIVGGEPLECELADKITEQFTGVEIYNEYGPTEATVGCMIHKYDRTVDILSTVPIGSAIDNVNVLILDNNFLPVPVGEIGEICIGGQSLSRGYLNDEKHTNERFVENPYEEDQQLYLTGDLARVLDYNLVEFIGRKDEQIKINGYRVEPEEIRKVIIENAVDINDCKIVANKTAAGVHVLSAYYIAENNISIEDTKDILLKFLPDYMVPVYYFKIDEFPLTQNGKLDKMALPTPESMVLDKLITPKNKMEKLLLECWQEVLNIEKIGINNNFFDVGGSSLKVVEVCELIKSHIDKSEEDLIMLFFKYPTIESFAEFLEGDLAVSKGEIVNEETLVAGKNRLGKLRKKI